jgi:DNA polymerase-3 subunit epsilon
VLQVPPVVPTAASPAAQAPGRKAPAGPHGRRGPYGYAVVDLEATGSSSRRHRVVELAVVLLGPDLAVQGEFTTLVDPQGPVGPTHIHGIAPEHLGGAPRFAEVAGRLLGLLRGRVLVGHNVGCDRAFLAAEYARVGLRLPAVPELCTMRLAERYGGPPPLGLSLHGCATAIGLDGWRPHTALGDARATASLFSYYAPRAAGLAERLAAAAGTRWPEPSALPVAGDALWMRRGAGHGRQPRAARGNEPGRSPVPDVRIELA